MQWQPLIDNYIQVINDANAVINDGRADALSIDNAINTVNRYMELTTNLRNAINEHVRLIHPNAISIARKMDKTDRDGFSYEVMLNTPTGTGPIFPVTQRWIHSVYKKEMISFLDKTLNAWKTVWISGKASEELNTSEDFNLISAFEGINNIRLREKGKDLYAITWMKLNIEWKKQINKKFSEMKRTWFISSRRVGHSMKRIPEYDSLLRDMPPKTIPWYEASESFLREGFGQKYLKEFVDKSKSQLNKKSSKDLEDKATTEIIKQVKCEDTYVEYNILSQNICGILWSNSKKCFRGLYKYPYENLDDIDNKKYHVDDLDDNWVQINFGHYKGFLDHVKSKASQKRPFVAVPPGKSKKLKKRKFEELYQEGSSLIPVQFPQGKHDRCLCDALASGFHYIGYKDLALLIHKYGTTHPPTPNFYNVVCDNFLLKNSTFKKKFQYAKINPNAFSILDKKGERGIFLVTLISSDGSCDHVVSIVDGKIFDPNQQYAVNLTKENLDYCCGDDCQYIGIKEGRHFYMRKDVRIRNIRQQK